MDSALTKFRQSPWPRGHLGMSASLMGSGGPGERPATAMGRPRSARFLHPTGGVPDSTLPGVLISAGGPRTKRRRVESARQRYTSDGTSPACRQSRCELTGSAARHSLLLLRPSARIVADGTAQGSADATRAGRPTIIVCNGNVFTAINAPLQTVQRVSLGAVPEGRIGDFQGGDTTPRGAPNPGILRDAHRSVASTQLCRLRRRETGYDRRRARVEHRDATHLEDHRRCRRHGSRYLWRLRRCHLRSSSEDHPERPSGIRYSTRSCPSMRSANVTLSAWQRPPRSHSMPHIEISFQDSRIIRMIFTLRELPGQLLGGPAAPTEWRPVFDEVIAARLAASSPRRPDATSSWAP